MRPYKPKVAATVGAHGCAPVGLRTRSQPTKKPPWWEAFALSLARSCQTFTLPTAKRSLMLRSSTRTRITTTAVGTRYRFAIISIISLLPGPRTAYPGQTLRFYTILPSICQIALDNLKPQKRDAPAAVHPKGCSAYDLRLCPQPQTCPTSCSPQVSDLRRFLHPANLPRRATRRVGDPARAMRSPSTPGPQTMLPAGP